MKTLLLVTVASAVAAVGTILLAWANACHDVESAVFESETELDL